MVLDQEAVKSRIGEEVRVKRTRLGWTQWKLGKKAGLSQTHVSEIENGYRDPQITTLLKLADALNMSLNQIVGRGG